MKKADKLMFRGATTAMRKIIVKSYRIQRQAVASSESHSDEKKKGMK